MDLVHSSGLRRRYQANDFWLPQNDYILRGHLSFPYRPYWNSAQGGYHCRARLELHLNLTRFIINNGTAVRSRRLAGELDEVWYSRAAAEAYGSIGLDGNDNVIRERRLYSSAEGRIGLFGDLMRSVHDVFEHALGHTFHLRERGFDHPELPDQVVGTDADRELLMHAGEERPLARPVMALDYRDWMIVGLETYWEYETQDAISYVRGLVDRASSNFSEFTRTDFFRGASGNREEDANTDERDSSALTPQEADAGPAYDELADGLNSDLAPGEPEPEPETGTLRLQSGRRLTGVSLTVPLVESGAVKLTIYAKLPDRVRFEVIYPRSLRSMFGQNVTGPLPPGIDGMIALIRHATGDAAERVQRVAQHVDIREQYGRPAAVNLLAFLAEIAASCRQHGVEVREVVSFLANVGGLTEGRDDRLDRVIADLRRLGFLERPGVRRRGNSQYWVLGYRYRAGLQECVSVIEQQRQDRIDRL